MKHTRLFLFLALLLMADYGRAAGTNFISAYPNTTSLLPTDLFIIERPGVSNYNVSGLQMLGEIGGQPTNSNLTDFAKWGTNAFFNVASNRAVSGLGTAAFTAATAYDASGVALGATNGIGIGSALSAFVPTNRFATSNDLYGASNALQGQITSGGITAPVGTNIAIYISNISSNLVYGNANTAIDTSSNLSFAIERTQINTTSNTIVGHTVNISGTANQITSSAGSQTLGANPATTLSLPSTLILPGTLNVTSDQTNQGNFSVLKTQTNFGGVVFKAGVTNETLTASTLLQSDANKKVISVANPSVASFPTNDASGNIGYTPMTDWAKTNQLLDATALGASAHVKTGPTTNLISSEDGAGYTNLVAWTHEGTTTNITATFNGTLQTFTVTNGPSIGTNLFFHYAGANGSVSYRIVGSAAYNTLAFDYQPKWLAGSNSVITNGVLSLTSYGGTNATQIEAAMRENQ